MSNVEAGRAARASGGPWLLVAAAVLLCLQWVGVWAFGGHPGQPFTALLPGLCIFGAAFLLTWAAEAAEKDIPQSVAIGILALIAVLPEYAVDMYFAWKAAKDPVYTAYAAANMTGANRLLIGVGWPAVLFACWFKRRQKTVRLSERNSPEIITLLVATLYSIILPLKSTLSLMDCVFLLSLFGVYAYMCSRAEVEEPEIVGPALIIAGLPALWRRLAVAALFLFSAFAIFISAEPFAEGILELGRHWGIEEFILVQWLAPLASEAPEFIVALLFALKGKAEVGLRTLVSSKVNQWTLLVGMLPAAYSLSAGHPAAMHLDARQAEEILLTSAQSLFGIVVLMNLTFSIPEAVMLFSLFTTQMFFPQTEVRYSFACLYFILSVGLMLAQRDRALHLREMLARVIKTVGG
ncbi:MAG: sodium:calcium antiporter [Elusimicrobia bacterium]|nr:sodium:calcium antiporter [Elusimicrobiota bacterium]